MREGPHSARQGAKKSTRGVDVLHFAADQRQRYGIANYEANQQMELPDWRQTTNYSS